MTQKIYKTNVQAHIAGEFIEMHNLDASQISFHEMDSTPILDYEAVCALSVKLTNIKNIEVGISNREFEGNEAIVTAFCKVTLPDGRTRKTEDSATLGESIGEGENIQTIRMAELVAQSRATRRGIRSVGINLLKAHQLWKENGGNAVEAHVNNDPRLPQYREVHALANKIGYIKGSDKYQYQNYIAEMFDGQTSSKELNDLQLQKLIVGLRSLARLHDSMLAAGTKQVA